MNKPLVSICIPNYNNGRYLDACIQSALDQEYSNTEIIFIDDHSSDKSFQIAMKYSDKIQIHFNSENLGQPENTNKCVKLSKGEYFVILHSDDRLLPCFFSKLLPLLQKNPKVGMAVGERIISDENDKQTKITPFYDNAYIIPGIKQAKIFMMTSFLPCQVLLRKNVFYKVGGVDLNHIVNLDGLLWFKCALEGDVAYIQDAVSIYRIHKDQTTAHYNKTIDHMIEYYVTLKKMFSFGEKIPYLKPYFKEAEKRVAELTVRYCHDVMKNRDYNLARRYLALATAFNLKIKDNNEYQKIKSCLDSGKPTHEVYSSLFDTNKQRDRGFSYTPPDGAKAI